jgi:riboflavin kinase / FMN adenylyltransferase
MIRLHNTAPIPADMRGAIMALGNFDGFHLGHQAVVGEVIRWARMEGRPAIVATFDPHPVRHFKPDAAPFRLTSLDQRQDYFAEAGADAMLVFHFDAGMANMPAKDWITQVLHQHIGAAGIVTGEDFTFGKGRAGNLALMQAEGMETRTVGAVHDEHGPISSSRIRSHLKNADPIGAAQLLTRPFAIRGMVQGGDRLGRTIGYPTANLDMSNYLRPAYGIYAVTGKLPDGRILHGAANLGIRPTFTPPKELLEPYFFDFAEDLYGQEIEVALHHFLRGEAKFDNLADLTAQMALDCDVARNLLGAPA